jgi:hypothetical protein
MFRAPCHLHVPIGMKSGSLNLLEPSGPVKACNGIALPLPLHVSSITCSPSGGLHKWYMEYCNIPSVVCEAPPDDEQVMLETYRGP